jgi:transcriptional regulator with XRE-family HTH domain
MSIDNLLPQSPFSENLVRRQFWAAVFGYAVAHSRLAARLSVEEAAELAGMTSSEWAAIEAGAVPRMPAQLRSIAGTVEVSYERLLNLALLCRDAWEL